MAMRNDHYLTARVWLVSLLFGLLSTGVLSAAIIDESVTIPLTDTSYVQDVFLNLFDPTLGHLQSVKVTVTGQLAGGWKYENTNPSKSSTAFSAGFSLDQVLEVTNVTMGGQSYLNLSAATTTNALAIPVMPKYDGITDGAGTSGATISSVNTSKTQVVVFNTAPTLAPFIGLGTTDFQVSADESDSTTAHSRPANFWLGTDSQGAAIIDIQYTYTPNVAAVPEPGTTELLILGSLGLAAAWWRRKKQQAQLAAALS